MNNFIFDVDQTLVDSKKTERETLEEAIYIVTGKRYDEEIMKQLTILPTNEFFKLINVSIDSDEYKLINKHWGLLLDEKKIDFYNGMLDVLIKLKEQDKFLAIATSRTEEELEELGCIMKNINLFKCIITSNKVKYPKPDPESINKIIEKYQLNREETVYVGDAKSDYEAAKNANINFAFASWGNENEEVDNNYLLKTPDDILNTFNNRLKK